MKVQIKKVREGAIIPKYQTPGSAGFDVHAIVTPDNPCYYEALIPGTAHDRDVGSGIAWEYVNGPALYIWPDTQCIVPTGLAFSIPLGYELQIRPRSGLAAKKCITVTNSPGTLDSDYLDELFILVYNLGRETFIIQPGDRIAQCVLKQVEQAEFELVEDFDAETKLKDRGGGLGSTGI